MLPCHLGGTGSRWEWSGLMPCRCLEGDQALRRVCEQKGEIDEWKLILNRCLNSRSVVKEEMEGLQWDNLGNSNLFFMFSIGNCHLGLILLSWCSFFTIFSTTATGWGTCLVKLYSVDHRWHNRLSGKVRRVSGVGISLPMGAWGEEMQNWRASGFL